AEEDATAVGPVIERVALPPPAVADKRRSTVEVRGRPALRFDAAPLVVAESDLVLLAAGTADVTVPVLDDRQGSDGKRHERSAEVLLAFPVYVSRSASQRET